MDGRESLRGDGDVGSGLFVHLALQSGEVGFDALEPSVRLVEFGLHLGATQQQHSAQLGRTHTALDDALDVGQGEPEILQDQHLQQVRELRLVIAAVPGGVVDLGGHQDAELVVVPQHARRNSAELRQVPDRVHACDGTG